MDVGAVAAKLQLDCSQWVDACLQAGKATGGFSMKGQDDFAALQAMSNTALGAVQQQMKDVAAVAAEAGAGISTQMQTGAEAFKGFSDEAVKAGESIHNFKSMSDEAMEPVQSLSSAVQKLGTYFAAAGAAIEAALGLSAKTFMDFDQAMHQVNLTAQLGQEQLAGMSEQVLRMSSDLGITAGPKELAQALAQVERSGFQGAEAMTILREAATTADAVMGKAGDAAHALDATLHAYSLTAADAAHVSDLVVATLEHAGNLTLPQFAQGMERVGPIAAASHISLEQLSAALMTLGQQGVQGIRGMTALASIIEKVHDLSPKAQKDLQALAAQGINIDISGALKENGLLGALKEIVDKSGYNMKLLEDIFGKGALQIDAVLKLMANDGAAFEQSLGIATTAAGTKVAAMAEQAKALAHQFGELKAEAQEAEIVIGQAFAPALSEAIALGQGLLDTFMGLSPATQQCIADFAAVSAAAIVVGGGIAALTPVWEAAGTVFTYVSEVALPAVAAGLAELAIPIAAVVAVGAVLYEAWQQDWGGIRETTSTVLSEVTGLLKDGFAFLQTTIPAVWSATWTAVRTEFHNVIDNDIKPVLQEFAAFWGGVWPDIKGIASDAMTLLGPIVKNVMAGLSETFHFGVTAIESIWSVCWAGVKATVVTVWPIIKGTIEMTLSAIRGTLDTALAIFQGNWHKAFSSINDYAAIFMKEINDTIQQTLDNCLQAMQDFVGEFYNAGANLLDSFINGAKSKRQDVASAFHEVIQDAATSAMSGIDWGTSGTWGTASSTGKSGNATADAANKAAQAALDASNKKVTAEEKFAAVINETAKQMQALSTGSKECAIQVRALLGARGIGIKLGTSTDPLDSAAVLANPKAYPSGVGVGNPAMADSLYGKDIGTLVNGLDAVRESLAGTIVIWKDAAGVVQHVGVNLGNGQVFQNSSSQKHPTVGPLTMDGFSSVSGVTPFGLDSKGTEKFMTSLQQVEAAVQKFKDGNKKAWEAIQADIANVGSTQDKETAKADADYQKQLASLEALHKNGTVDEQTYQHTREQLEQVHQQKLDTINATATAKDKALQDDLKIYAAKAEGDKTAIAIAESNKQFDNEISKLELLKIEKPQKAAEINANIVGLEKQKELAVDVIRKKAHEAFLADLDKKYQELLKTNDKAQQLRIKTYQAEVETGHLTVQQYLQDLATELDATNVSEAQKDSVIQKYHQAYKSYLDQQLKWLDNNIGLKIQKEKELIAQLKAVDDGGLANQEQIATVEAQLVNDQIAKQKQQYDEMKAAVTSMTQGILTNLEGVLLEHKTVADAINSIWKDVLKNVLGWIEKMLVNEMLQAVGLAWAQGGPLFGGPMAGAMVGEFGALMGALSTIHDGGLVVPGGVQSFHGGGSVGFPQLNTDEVLAKLQVGEVVLPRNIVNTLRQGNGGSARPITIHIDSFHAHHSDDVDAIAEQIGNRMLQQVRGY